MPGPHHWRRRFRENVCRWTTPRESVLNLLSRTPGHLSAKDIYAALYRTHPGLGLTTVYRTLELLHGLGIVQRVSAGDGRNRYQIRSERPGDHHHHLICTRCGHIIDYRDFVEEELELVKKTERALSQRYGFEIRDHNIEFMGLCKECR